MIFNPVEYIWEKEEKMIFIPHNVPSLKNSKISTTVGKGKNKRTVLLPSKTVKKYLQKIGVKKYRIRLTEKQKAKGLVKVENYTTKLNLFRDSVGNYFKNSGSPVICKIHFVRDTKRKFDFHNGVQIIADLLTAHEFIPDDDMDCFIPVPMRLNGKWYSVDPKNPGVYLKKVEDLK